MDHSDASMFAFLPACLLGYDCDSATLMAGGGAEHSAGLGRDAAAGRGDARVRAAAAAVRPRALGAGPLPC